ALLVGLDALQLLLDVRHVGSAFLVGKDARRRAGGGQEAAGAGRPDTVVRVRPERARSWSIYQRDRVAPKTSAIVPSCADAEDGPLDGEDRVATAALDLDVRRGHGLDRAPEAVGRPVAQLPARLVHLPGRQ